MRPSLFCSPRRKYAEDLAVGNVSSAWIVSCSSMCKYLRGFPIDQTFCITNKKTDSKLGVRDTDDQPIRKVICDSDSDEVNFRIAFQVGTLRLTLC